MAIDPPKTARAGVPGNRRRARVLALQVLYEVDVTGHPWQEAARLQAEASRTGRQAVRFAEECIGSVLEHQEELDVIIQRLAPAWPLAQLSVVDRNILRLALYELRSAGTEPPKVVINEAVELAKLYGGESSSRFVNGVLGTALAEQELQASAPASTTSQS